MIRENDCWDTASHRSVMQYASSQLWRHIRANAKESEAEEIFLNLTKLTRRDLTLLADIRFLLSNDVYELLWIIAPKIIQRLSKASVNETITDRNKVRGRIDWPKTTVVQTVSGNDKSLFVYTQKAQIFDLPENRLFLHMLQQINSMAKAFVSDDYLSLTWYAEADLGGKWIHKISVIASKTEKMLKQPVVSKISAIKELNEKFIYIAHRCRQNGYKQLASIGEIFLQKKQNPLEYLNAEYCGNILEPLNKDSLFEIAVLFKTMETAAVCGWTETRAGLLGGSSNTASIYKKNNAVMKLYTQHIPPEFKEVSSYGPLMSDYGLGESLRRPDIIIEITAPEYKRFLIVEVKRSERRSYLADGTYKLLGYLKDFERVRPAAELTGFLTGWSSIGSCEYRLGTEVGLFSWENYGDGFAKYLLNN